jgi:hypothetical protein
MTDWMKDGFGMSEFILELSGIVSKLPSEARFQAQEVLEDLLNAGGKSYTE